MPGGISLIKCRRTTCAKPLLSQLSEVVLCCAPLLRRVSTLGLALLFAGTGTSHAAIEYLELDTYTVDGLHQALVGASAEDQARIYTKLSRHELERNVQQSREHLRAAERLVFFPISTHFTATPGIPLTSPRLKCGSFKCYSGVKPRA